MRIQETLKLRTLQDCQKKISLLFAIHCAPVLSGVKAANMMTVAEKDFFYIRSLLENTDISYYFFRTGNEQGIAYLYRERELTGYIHREEIISFLGQYGYAAQNVDGMLSHLWERMYSYRQGQEAFPHEIGVFLEYPLPDVQGFVENGGRNYLFAGYWKVYQDAKGAAAKFRQYDRQREKAVQAVVSGHGILEIVK